MIWIFQEIFTFKVYIRNYFITSIGLFAGYFICNKVYIDLVTDNALDFYKNSAHLRCIYDYVIFKSCRQFFSWK